MGGLESAAAGDGHDGGVSQAPSAAGAHGVDTSVRRAMMCVRLLAFVCIGACAAPQGPAQRPVGPDGSPGSSVEKRSLAAPSTGEPELDRLLADLCDEAVVLLGEADHGDGRTWEVKTRLVGALV